MKKNLFGLLVVIGLSFGVAHAANQKQFTPDLYPIANSQYYLGTTTQAYLAGTFDSLCLTGDSCISTWPTGGGGGVTGGTTGKVARWTGTTTLSSGILFDNATVAGVNATSSTVSFNIQGTGSLNPFRVASSTGTALLTVAPNGSTTLSSLASGFVKSNSGSLYVDNSTYQLQLIDSTNVWVDSNRVDSYTADGSIARPFKTLSAAISGASSTASSLVFRLAPGTYTEASNVTWPNKPIIVYGNQASIVINSGAGTMTFSNSFDIYDLTVVGTVNQNDTNVNNPHYFQSSTISGSAVMSGISIFNGMTLLNGTTTVKSGAQLNTIASNISNYTVVQGIARINDTYIQRTDNNNYAVVATTSGSTLIMATVDLYNFGTGGGVNCANGATSTPNELSSIKVSVVGTNAIDCGSSATNLSNYNAINLTNGARLTANATNPYPGYYGSIYITATTTLASATTTINGVNYFWPGTQAVGTKILQNDGNGNLTWVTDQTGGGGSLSGGIVGYVGVWASSTSMTTGILLDNGTVAGVRATSSTVTFNVQGAAGVNPFNVSSSTGSSLLLLAQTGNLGVATSTPGYTLTVAGTAQITSLSNCIVITDANGVLGCETRNSSIDLLSSDTIPDTSGNVYYEPFSISTSTAAAKFASFVFLDTATKDCLYGNTRMPLDYTGTVQVQPEWTAATTTGNVVWEFAYSVIGGDDTTSFASSSFTETASTTDAAPSALFRRLTPTINLTSANFSAGSTVTYRLCRDGSSASDTMPATSSLVSLYLLYAK